MSDRTCSCFTSNIGFKKQLQLCQTVIPLDSTWTLIMYTTVTLQKITWLLLANISWLQMLIINNYTDVLPGYSFVSKCLITQITGIQAITLYILSCTVRLLCWLNMLSLCMGCCCPLVFVRLGYVQNFIDFNYCFQFITCYFAVYRITLIYNASLHVWHI